NKEVKRDILGRPIRDLSNDAWWGIPRQQIQWYPEVDNESCIGCGLCIITCGRNVFDWNLKENKPIVARPYNCLVGCSTCSNLCPRDAISFPPLGKLRKLRDKAGVVRKASERIREVKDSIK
ncbi:MAG: ferredoxin family protein, partial [Candidatus Brockarchaeota archaeon]|nr:ferredoxin family protein [Candidatus Brockarchaeota archaeon]